MSRSHSLRASANHNHPFGVFSNILTGVGPCRVALIAATIASSGLAAHAASPPGQPSGAPIAASVVNPDGSPVERPPDTAAIVNGHTITLTQVTDMVMRVDAANITHKLIDDYLVDQECKRRGIVVPDSEVDASVENLARMLAPTSLEEGLKEHHDTLENLKSELRESLEREELVIDKVKPTYIVHCKAIMVHFGTPNSPQAQQFKPHTEDEALKILADVQDQLKAGKDFGDLATQYSEDVNSKDKKGDVGMTYDGAPLDQALIRAALTLKKGQVSPSPVKTINAYYLLEVVSTSDDHAPDEDAAYAAAEDHYRHQQAEYLVPDYMKNLRAQAKIVDYIP